MPEPWGWKAQDRARPAHAIPVPSRRPVPDRAAILCRVVLPHGPLTHQLFSDSGRIRTIQDLFAEEEKQGFCWFMCL